MSHSNDKAWKTKYGPRRVRQELPTLEEAIFAAQGLSDDLDEQAAIAASLEDMDFDLGMMASNGDEPAPEAYAAPEIGANPLRELSGATPADREPLAPSREAPRA